MVTLIVSLIVGIIGSMLYAEFAGRSGKLADRLVDGAVRRLPRRYRERMREEWAADAASQPTPASILVRSFGFRMASETILYRERRRVRLARAARRQLVVSIAGTRMLLPMPPASFIKAVTLIDDTARAAVRLVEEAVLPHMNPYRIVLWSVFSLMMFAGAIYLALR